MEEREELGKGRFGSVRKVKVNGLVCAAKRIMLSHLNESGRKAIERELAILKKVRHSNIVRFYGEERRNGGSELVLYSEFFTCSLKTVIANVRDATRDKFAIDEVWYTYSLMNFHLYALLITRNIISHFASSSLFVLISQ